MPHPGGRPWIIAHRGASLQARENTLEAFRLARELGADAVELDARRTADGAIVVHHDDSVAGRAIVAMTRQELQEAAPHVPDLSDTIAACAGMWVDIEVKNDPRDADWDPANGVAAEIAHTYREADVVITSFNPAAVEVAAAAGMRTGLLLGRGLDPAQQAGLAAEAGHVMLLPHVSSLAGHHGEHVVAAAAGAGIDLVVWTVDDPGEMARLALLGVGGIATNAPDVARSVLLENRDGQGR